MKKLVHENKHAYKGNLNKHGYKGNLNKHAYKGNLNKHAYKGNLNKHGYKGNLNKHAYKGNLNKHAYKGNLNKHAYKGNLLQKINWSRKDSTTFWKLLDKLEHKQDNTIFTNNISEERWKINFKNNFNTSSERYPLPLKTAEQGPLDIPICEEEIQLATYILRNGKSPGYDSISNEMLLCLYNVPEIIKLLFNSILQNPMIINKWNISVISPLHKKGSKLDPDNYRAISLLSCFGKFFLAILNQRITKFAIEQNILSKSQLGFLPGNKTYTSLYTTLLTIIVRRKRKITLGVLLTSKKHLIAYQETNYSKSS